MDPTVSDIIKVLDSVAPPALAEAWDNVGLQVGDPERTVKNIWIALDPTYQVDLLDAVIHTEQVEDAHLLMHRATVEI